MFERMSGRRVVVGSPSVGLWVCLSVFLPWWMNQAHSETDGMDAGTETAGKGVDRELAGRQRDGVQSLIRVLVFLDVVKNHMKNIVQCTGWACIYNNCF